MKIGERGLRLRAAEVLLKSGENDRARAHLTDLVRRDPKDRVAQLMETDRKATTP